MSDPGFSISEDVLTSGRCFELATAFDSTPRRAGTRNLISHPAAAALAGDEALLKIARRWVGPGAVPYRATLFAKSAGRSWLVAWHQDTMLPLETAPAARGWGPASTKQGVVNAQAPAWALARIVALRVHLDPSHGNNGPLRVIPGSHNAGVLSAEGIAQAVARDRSVACLVGRGGVIAMRPLLLHASPKAVVDTPRRVLHIEYAADLQLGPVVRLRVA